MSKDKDQKDQKQGLSESEKSHAQQDPPPTFFEWGVRLVSLLVILGFIGYFTWSAIEPDSPPNISLEMETDKIEQRGGTWVCPVVVTNKGDMSVHTLSVRAVLQGTEKEEEMVEIMLLGPDEAVTTEFWFDQMPTPQNIQLDVASYVFP